MASNLNPNLAGRKCRGGLAQKIKRHFFEVSRRGHLVCSPKGLPEQVSVFFHALSPPSLSALSECVTVLQCRGYEFVGTEQYLQAKAGEQLALLSFDDNYSTWLTGARMLAEKNICATFYVNTIPYEKGVSAARIESYYDVLGAKADRVPLEIEELQMISELGHEVGCHTHTHSNLGGMSPSEAEKEILKSREILQSLVGKEVTHFSIPFGLKRHIGPEVPEKLLALGFKSVAYALPGMLWQPSSPSCLHRTMWQEFRSKEENLENLRLNASLFTKVTGRSAIG